MSNTATNAKEIVGMKLTRLSFEKSNYNTKGEYITTPSWKASANLEGTGGNGFKSVDLKLNETIATEIMRLLIPTIVQQASESAQKLADEAKQLAAAVGDCVIKSLPVIADV